MKKIGNTRIVKTSNVNSSKAGLRKRQNNCIEAENTLISDISTVQDHGSLKTNMTKSNVENTGQEQVSEQIVSPFVTGNNENGCKSSHNLKQTFKMAHKEMLPCVSNLHKK